MNQLMTIPRSFAFALVLLIGLLSPGCALDGDSELGPDAGASIAAPSNGIPALTATSVSTTQVNLSWTDPIRNESGYLVERGTSAASGFVLIASLGKNGRSYSSSGLSPGTTYYFRVRAILNNGGSIYSNVANALFLPGPRLQHDRELPLLEHGIGHDPGRVHAARGSDQPVGGGGLDLDQPGVGRCREQRVGVQDRAQLRHRLRPDRHRWRQRDQLREHGDDADHNTIVLNGVTEQLVGFTLSHKSLAYTAQGYTVVFNATFASGGSAILRACPRRPTPGSSRRCIRSD